MPWHLCIYSDYTCTHIYPHIDFGVEKKRSIGVVLSQCEECLKYLLCIPHIKVYVDDVIMT